MDFQVCIGLPNFGNVFTWKDIFKEWINIEGQDYMSVTSTIGFKRPSFQLVFVHLGKGATNYEML